MTRHGDPSALVGGIGPDPVGQFPAGFNPNRDAVLLERSEVACALIGLTERTGKDVFTAGEVYAEIMRAGMRHPKSTVVRTMQRMKQAASRPPHGGTRTARSCQEPLNWWRVWASSSTAMGE